MKLRDDVEDRGWSRRLSDKGGQKMCDRVEGCQAGDRENGGCSSRPVGKRDRDKIGWLGWVMGEGQWSRRVLAYITYKFVLG